MYYREMVTTSLNLSSKYNYSIKVSVETSELVSALLHKVTSLMFESARDYHVNVMKIYSNFKKIKPYKNRA